MILRDSEIMTRIVFPAAVLARMEQWAPLILLIQINFRPRRFDSVTRLFMLFS